MHKTTIARALCVAIGAAVLSGCAGITRQLVTEPTWADCTQTSSTPGDSRAARDGSARCSAQTRCERELDAASCGAIALADRYRAQYLDAARNRAGLAGATNLVAAGAGLAGLFYALDGRAKYQDRIRRLGTVAVGAYAINTLYAQSPLTLIYLNGAAAMECSVFVMAPTFLPRDRMGEADAEIEALRKAIAGFRDVLTILETNAPASDLELLAAAESVLALLVRRREEIRTAGVRASMRVQQIATEVNRQILLGQPDANSVFALVRAMPGMATSIGVTAPAVAGKAGSPTEKVSVREYFENLFDQRTDKAARVADSLEKLSTARQALQTATQNAAARLVRLTLPAFDDADIAACSLAERNTKFEVSPAARSIVIKDKASASFVITADGVPSATVSGNQADAIELRPLEVLGDGTFKLTIVARTPTGTVGPQVTMRSSNGWRTVHVQVNVSKSD